MEIKTVKISDLKAGPMIHKTLPSDFIERVKNFKQAITEVETSSLESTLENFQRDSNPETELILWEHMAKMYQWTIVANAGFSLPQKKEVFSILLQLSMGMKDFSKIKTLTKETIAEIVDRYQYE
jgi:hypothetical protein